MKTLLAYPPFAWPSAPPLGISLLKSYVRERAGFNDVECLDLNLELFTAPGPAAHGLCRSCPRRGHGGCIPPAAFLEDGLYERAADFFRRGGRTFYSPRRHAREYIFLRTFMEQFRACHEAVLKPYVEGKEETAAAEKLIARAGRRILSRNPDLVGFSAHSDQAAWALALAKWLKRNSSVSIVIGGFFPSFCGASDIVKAFPFVDYAVRGEGERALAGLIGMLEGGKSKPPPGLVRVTGGKVRSSRARHERDLDALPFPDFSDFNLSGYFSPRPVLPVLGSRGCPWGRCSFCAHGENYAKVFRERTAENVAAEIRRNKEIYGAKHFLFCDEHIGGPRLEELSAAVAGEGIEFGVAGLKPGRDVTRARLEAARSAGCRWVYIGAESFTPRILRLMRKGVTPAETMRVISDCRSAGVTPFVSYIWGFPSHTRTEVESEADVIRESGGRITLPDDGHTFTLEKGSPAALDPAAFHISRMEPIPMFTTSEGKTVYSGKYRFAPASGLTPLQAQAAYRPGPGVPYETHSFWESLVLLSGKYVKLVFPREEFYSKIFPDTVKRLTAALRKKTASETNPNPELLLALGLCLARLGKTREAEKHFTRIRRMKTARALRAAAAYQAGLLKEESGDFTAAEKCYRLARGANIPAETEAAVAFHVAQCAERSGDVEAAIRLYSDQLNSRSDGPFSTRAITALGSCYVMQKEYLKGITILEKAAAEDMEGRYALQIYFNLIEAYEKTGRKKETEKVEALLKELL